MNWIENILIIGGISLDVFAAMEIEGSLLAEVKKKSLFMACFLVTILQLGFSLADILFVLHCIRWDIQVMQNMLVKLLLFVSLLFWEYAW